MEYLNNLLNSNTQSGGVYAVSMHQLNQILQLSSAYFNRFDDNTKQQYIKLFGFTPLSLLKGHSSSKMPQYRERFIFLIYLQFIVLLMMNNTAGMTEQEVLEYLRKLCKKFNIDINNPICSRIRNALSGISSPPSSSRVPPPSGTPPSSSRVPPPSGTPPSSSRVPPPSGTTPPSETPPPRGIPFTSSETPPPRGIPFTSSETPPPRGIPFTSSETPPPRGNTDGDNDGNNDGNNDTPDNNNTDGNDTPDGNNISETELHNIYNNNLNNQGNFSRKKLVKLIINNQIIREILGFPENLHLKDLTPGTELNIIYSTYMTTNDIEDENQITFDEFKRIINCGKNRDKTNNNFDCTNHQNGGSYNNIDITNTLQDIF